MNTDDSVVMKTQSSATRTRLEQLDDFEEGSVREMGDLSQQEYVSRIEQLNQELVQAWHSDCRVKALKIAIQVCFNCTNTQRYQDTNFIQYIILKLG